MIKDLEEQHAVSAFICNFSKFLLEVSAQLVHSPPLSHLTTYLCIVIIHITGRVLLVEGTAALPL